MSPARKVATAAMAAFVSTGFVSTGCTSDETNTVCDRDCLVSIADRYLAAIAAHDLGVAPLADNVGFVENITRMEPGEGLWASAAGAATEFRIYVPDPVQGTIGLLTVMDRQTDEGIVPAQLAVRLKIEDRRIVEAEHLVADVLEEGALANLEAPRPNLTAVVPESERMARAELIEIAASYYDALDQSDGDLAPFASDCERQENGMITAGSTLAPARFDSVDVNGHSPPPVARDCVGQMHSRRFAYIDRIDNRRVFAIDPVQGLAMGLSHFRQSMSRGPHRLVAPDGSQVMWDEQREPYDLPAAHIFKIASSEIHEVEAVGIFVPYGSQTGWE